VEVIQSLLCRQQQVFGMVHLNTKLILVVRYTKGNGSESVKLPSSAWRLSMMEQWTRLLAKSPIV